MMFVDLLYAAITTVYYFLAEHYVTIVLFYLLACLPAFAFWFFREWLPDARKYIKVR